MDERLFLGSRWVGEGTVQTLFGRTLRRFVVTYESVWSEIHQAFHIDERVDYADGRSIERNWAITKDERGYWSGTDDSGGRMTLRSRSKLLIIDLNRSKVVKGFSASALRLNIRAGSPDTFIAEGTSWVLGLPVTRTSVLFSSSRTSSPRRLL